MKSPRLKAAALYWLCLGGEGHGYPPAATLPGPCQHHQHGLHRDVARTVQGRVALERAAIARSLALMLKLDTRGPAVDHHFKLLLVPFVEVHERAFDLTPIFLEENA